MMSGTTVRAEREWSVPSGISLGESSLELVLKKVNGMLLGRMATLVCQ